MTDGRGQASSENLDQIIRESGLDALLNKETPVDIAKIAMAVGVTEVAKADIPVAGMLVPDKNTFKILVKKDIDIVRRRFSCAHELAHVLLNPEANFSMRRTPVPADDDLERNCEAMAALLLMPDPTFSRLANREKPGIRTIEKLAQIFLTSIQATALRFVDVVMDPCVLIVSEVEDGHQGFGLRVRWSYQNSKRPDGKSQYFIPRGGSLRIATARDACQTRRLETAVEIIKVGGLKGKVYTESRMFGFNRYRYVLTLVFPNCPPRLSVAAALSKRQAP